MIANYKAHDHSLGLATPRSQAKPNLVSMTRHLSNFAQFRAPFPVAPPRGRSMYRRVAAGKITLCCKTGIASLTRKAEQS